MAEAQLNVMDLTATELLATASGIAAALTGNEHFLHPNPPVAEIEQLITELGNADKEYLREVHAANQAKAARDMIADRLRLALTAAVAYVQKASDGDLTKILSANLHVEEGMRLFSFGSAGDVELVTASAGDQPGEIDLAWDPAARADGYEVEIAYDLHGEGPWEQIGATTKSKLTLEQLEKHTIYWFRVRAINERGAGDWSEPVMKLAP